MAEHHELVAEMAALEQMGTQERQKLAKKRRLQQLKKWGQREKEWIAKEKQLNKWLANVLNEENTGLNLKQYTTYSSNNRSKKKLQLTSSVSIPTGGYKDMTAATNGNGNSNNINDLINNNSIISNELNVKTTRFTTKLEAPKSEMDRLAPNGRVHFDVGVMLIEAAARNDYDEVKRLLMLGVSPDSVNHDGLTALHQCCIDASEPMMKLLLEFDANVDARDTEQWTPLHAACTCGHLNLVKILVENGADLLAVNGDGNMPFDTCEDDATLDYIESQMVNQGITQEMIDLTRASTEVQMISDLEKQVTAGKDLNAANEMGVTQLHVAAANGYTSVVKFLLKHDVNVNVCDKDQWRPLHGAACWGNEQHFKIVELLVESGADINSKTLNDETVFDLCNNAQLLEKLNELKDELESKQASGADRLRRTQSRTNSRVHSVRRTSVRDKNQISRREAREEALLRVENSPLNSPPSNGATNTQVNGVSESQDIKVLIINGSEHLKESIQSPAFGCSTAAKNLSELNDSKPVSAIKSATNGPFEPNIIDSNSVKSSNEDSTDRLANQSRNSASAHTSNESITSKRKNMVKQPNIESNDIPSVLSVNDSKESMNSASSKWQSSSVTLQEPQIIKTTSAKLKAAPSRVAIKTSNIVNSDRTNSDRSTHARDTIDDHTLYPHYDPNSLQSNNDTACDSTTTTTITVNMQQKHKQQMAPNNYTLSNLKKQRSDLRMRTTIIGAQTNSNDGGGCPAAPTSNTANCGLNHDDCVDPQSTSLQTNCIDGDTGCNRSESPALTFRKFRGEPSEVIGGKERNDRRKWCCTII